MIEIANHKEWYLDDNGVNVMTHEGKHVVDLHADCEVTDVRFVNAQIQVELVKTEENVETEYFNVGDRLSLTVGNVANFDVPKFDFPETFEGIYDFDGSVLSLCIGNNTCYKVEGENLQISLT